MGVVRTFWRLFLAAMIAMATPLSCCCAQGLLRPDTAHASDSTPATSNCCHDPQSASNAIAAVHGSDGAHESPLPLNGPMPAKHCTKRTFIGAAENVTLTQNSTVASDAGVLLHPLLSLVAMLPALDSTSPSRLIATDPSPPLPRLRLTTQLCVMTT